MTNNNELERLNQIKDRIEDSEVSASIKIIAAQTYINAAKAALEEMARQAEELRSVIEALNEKVGDEEQSDLDAEEAFRMDAKNEPLF